MIYFDSDYPIVHTKKFATQEARAEGAYEICWIGEMMTEVTAVSISADGGEMLTRRRTPSGGQFTRLN